MPGDYVTDFGFGITVTVQSDEGYTAEGPRTYDSDNRGGLDPDLEIGNGNILIIQSAQDEPPNDFARGGNIVFKFTVPSFIGSITFVDTEKAANINLKRNGMRFESADGLVLGDLQSGDVAIGVGGVDELAVIFPESGGIVEIQVCVPFCVNDSDDVDSGCTVDDPVCINTATGLEVGNEEPGDQCGPLPTPEPTPAPTDEPTPSPTLAPVPDPTPFPTPSPTKEPTALPTVEPTTAPTKEPTPLPTPDPTEDSTVCRNTGSGTDEGCTDDVPICVLDDGSQPAHGAPGDKCVVCVDDANGGHVDSGCNNHEPICFNQHECVVCINDAYWPYKDSGCSLLHPVCKLGYHKHPSHGAPGDRCSW